MIPTLVLIAQMAVPQATPPVPPPGPGDVSAPGVSFTAAPSPDGAAANRILESQLSSRLLPLTAGVAQPTSLPLRPALAAGVSPLEAEDQLVEYSDGYFTRQTIHKWASYATLPLFVAQYIAGQKLIDEGDAAPAWARDFHGPLAGAIGGLFAVNTVTGAWNWWESRPDPEGRTRRTIHSALMLLADVGFVATGALAEESEHGGFSDNTAHRNVAIASMSMALVSYLMMIPPFRRD